MGLETGVTYIDDLVATNPDGSVDTLDESDNHHRIIKTAVQGSFPNLGNAAVTLTAAEINDLPTKTGVETLTNKTLADPILQKQDDIDEGGQITFEGSASFDDVQVDIKGSTFRVFNSTDVKTLEYDTTTGILTANSGFVGSLTGNCSGTALSVTGTGVITAAHIATDAVASDEIAANAVGASEFAASLTRGALTSLGASSAYVIPAGLYNLLIDEGALSSIFLEIKDSGDTWRRNEYNFGGGLVLGDGANTRLYNAGTGSGNYLFARQS